MIDLVNMQAIYWDDATQGMKFERKPILRAGRRSQEWRDKMVEAAAEANEELMNKYLESGELSVEEIRKASASARSTTRSCRCAVRLAFKNKGVQMLDAVIDYLPSPIDRRSRGEPERRARIPQARRRRAVRALAFKIMTDPFVGQLTFIRVYSGVLTSGDTVYTSMKGKQERIGRPLQMHANEREEIKEVRAGHRRRGRAQGGHRRDDLDVKNVITLERMEFPEPVIAGRRAEDQGRPGKRWGWR